MNKIRRGFKMKCFDKGDNINLFEDCEIFDITLTEDWDEIYEALVKINSIYVKLPKVEQAKDIYLNFDYAEKCIVPSYKKKYLAFPEPINRLLGFEWDPELEDLYGESEEEATYNALYSSVQYLIEQKRASLIDTDLPF